MEKREEGKEGMRKQRRKKHQVTGIFWWAVETYVASLLVRLESFLPPENGELEFPSFFPLQGNLGLPHTFAILISGEGELESFPFSPILGERNVS